MTIDWDIDGNDIKSIDDFIDFNYFDAKPREKEKLKKLTLELYVNLNNRKSKKMETLINSKLMDKKYKMTFMGMNKRYNFFLNILKETGLILRDDGYLSSNITENPKPKSIWVRKNDKIHNNHMMANLGILNGEPTPKSKWIKKYPNHKNIIDMVYETYFDIEMARRFFYSKLGQLNKKGQIITNSMIYDAINKLRQYNERLLTFSIDEKTGRLFNPLTNINHMVRPFLKSKSDGEYLIELDLKNSQPLFLTLFVKNEKYKKAVEEGIFYDELAEYLKLTREEAKEYSMKYIFYGDYKLEKGKTKEALDYLYPGFLDELQKLKEKLLLWQTLQTAEADIFLKLGGPYISIHDGIMIKKDDLDYYYTKIMSIFENKNLNPKIKITKNETI